MEIFTLHDGYSVEKKISKSLALRLVHGGIPVVAQWVKNPTSIHEDVGSIPGLTQWVKDLELP